MAEPVVTTVEGKLRGLIEKNFDGEQFYSFLGVPYAKPPIGNLRFKAPEALEPWSDIKNATKEGSAIYQRDTLINFTFNGSEDGLYLNVFTKNINPQNSKLSPVMVWIHGGGFLEGSNSKEIYGPDYLMMEDIVLVTINYRVGVLGFLQFDDPSLEVFGNAGLKDQIAALKWVQRNIRNFGGDPNNVTIFGESAGAASVHYLVLSSATKGLFHKAICQSGSVAHFWSYGKSYVKDFLKHIGKEELSEKDALEYLRGLKVEELHSAQESYFKTQRYVYLGILSPTAETPNPDAVISKHPIQNLLDGNYNKVPLLTGYNSLECLFIESEMFRSSDMLKPFTIMNPEMIVSDILNGKENSEIHKNFCQKLKDIYGDTKMGMILLISHYTFAVHGIGCARTHVKTSDKPVYLYKMSLDAEFNLLKKLGRITAASTCHFDDIGYLFKNTSMTLKTGSPEETYVRRFVKLWTNFAKYGNPTPKNNDLGVMWKPVDDKSVNFLNIDKELVCGVDPESNKMEIWKEIYLSNPANPKLLY